MDVGLEQPPNNELELVNMTSPSQDPTTLEIRVVTPMSVDVEENNGLNTNMRDGGAGPEENGGEEMKSLTTSMPINRQSSDSISPMPVLWKWKSRRRPGSSSDGNKVMMNGTMFQGSSGGTPIEVEVELSERELQRLTSRESHKQKKEPCRCELIQGPHIVFLSLVCVPVAFMISLFLVFYNGSITWYNLFIYFSEEKSFIHRVTLCPLLVLSFPITVGLSTLILSIAASVIQISWSWVRWRAEILDGEKGFYGWLCDKMNLPDCSPYQVVILEDNTAF